MESNTKNSDCAWRHEEDSSRNFQRNLKPTCKFGFFYSVLSNKLFQLTVSFIEVEQHVIKCT